MTREELNMYMEMATEQMDESIEHLKRELLKIRTGKASPTMLQGLLVSYYGSMTPLSQVANVLSEDARTLVIQPWEKNMLNPIEKAIFEANLGVTPMNNGELIRINIPALTEDRRRDLVKTSKTCGEDAKISVRNARRETMENIKTAVKNGLPEDIGKRKEDETQKLTDSYGKKIDELVEAKEKDIMTI